eukprot:241447_1
MSSFAAFVFIQFGVLFNTAMTRHIVYVNSNKFISLTNQTGKTWSTAFASLQYALSSAEANDEIWIAYGIYENIQQSTSFLVNNTPVRLYGGFIGNETSINDRYLHNVSTILSGNNQHVVIMMINAPHSLLDGIIIEHGLIYRVNLYDWSDSGAGGLTIVDSDNVTLNNIKFNSNSGRRGGGLSISDSNNVVINNCQFNTNHATYGGALYTDHTVNVIINNTKFHDNSVWTGHVRGQPFGGYGGAICTFDDTNMIIDNTILNRNNAQRLGGGLYTSGTGHNMIIRNTQFNGNNAMFGGGARTGNSHNAVITNVTFNNNNADVSGGGIFTVVNTNMIITNTALNNNTATDGGGLYTKNSHVTINNVQFNRNNAVTNGGALYTDASHNMKIIKSVFNNNNAGSNGGALYTDESNNITINDSVMNSNNAKHYGGGIMTHNSRKMIIIDCQFDSNNAHFEGAGLYANTSDNFNIFNTVFNNNNAGSDGGALYTKNSDYVIINNSVLNGNSATGGGGLCAYNSHNMIIHNTQFNENMANNDGGGLCTYFSDNMSVYGTLMTNNEANFNGGAIYAKYMDAILINNSEFNNNTAMDGAALYVVRINVISIMNVWCGHNNAGRFGGCAMFFTPNYKSINCYVFVDQLTVVHNSARNGGGTYLRSVCDYMWINSTFSENKALISGGATVIESALSETMVMFNGCKWNSNRADYEGGGLFINNTNVEFFNSSIVHNSAGLNGGGIVVYGNSANIIAFNSVIDGNSADFGAGISLISTTYEGSSSQVFLYNSRLNSNTALIKGGGMYVNGGMFNTFVCVVSSNTAHLGEGGGLFYEHGVYADLNSVFINNTGYRGGGIYIGNDHIVLNQTNIIQNNASFGGGVYNTQYFVDVKNRFLVDFEGNRATLGGGAVYNNLFKKPGYFLLICNNNTIHCNQNNMASYGSNMSSKAKSIVVTLQNYTKYASDLQILHLYHIVITIYDDYANRISKTNENIFVEWNSSNNNDIEFEILETHNTLFANGSANVFLELKLTDGIKYNNIKFEYDFACSVLIQGNRLSESLTNIPCNNIVHKLTNPGHGYIVVISVIFSIISMICVVCASIYAIYRNCTNNINILYT